MLLYEESGSLSYLARRAAVFTTMADIMGLFARYFYLAYFASNAGLDFVLPFEALLEKVRLGLRGFLPGWRKRAESYILPPIPKRKPF